MRQVDPDNHNRPVVDGYGRFRMVNLGDFTGTASSTDVPNIDRNRRICTDEPPRPRSNSGSGGPGAWPPARVAIMNNGTRKGAMSRPPDLECHRVSRSLATALFVWDGVEHNGPADDCERRRARSTRRSSTAGPGAHAGARRGGLEAMRHTPRIPQGSAKTKIVCSTTAEQYSKTIRGAKLESSSAIGSAILNNHARGHRVASNVIRSICLGSARVRQPCPVSNAMPQSGVDGSGGVYPCHLRAPVSKLLVRTHGRARSSALDSCVVPFCDPTAQTAALPDGGWCSRSTSPPLARLAQSAPIASRPPPSMRRSRASTTNSRRQRRCGRPGAPDD